MTFASYTELADEITSITHRAGDTEFEGKIASWVRLFEVRANRVLRVRDMEEAFPSVALVDGAAPLPADFLAFKELRFDADEGYALLPKPLQYVRDRRLTSASPTHFAVTKAEVVCDGAGDIAGTYYQRLPGLEANTTNWLLEQHPDLYLFGTLVEAALWMQDDSRIPLWAEKASALLEMVQGQDNANAINGGPLTARAR